ncbi:MAG: bifunctional folylpolyglutamate synthase/dihydrofolate synthase [Proteobacteria bacterium]|nr:bifunctional folylpolyglutamate synthase/dihydrofolate synthase [Pseudomonadota bacterium]
MSHPPPLSEVLDRLTALHPKRIDLGLDRITRLLAKLGNPHHHLPPVIHIAGTNGKGSTLAFLRAMLETNGAKVHAYTSPHLVRFNERIRLRGTLISDTALAEVLCEAETANNNETITFFEITTATAFLAFARHPADTLLLEVGLGGRMDATNVLAPEAVAASVITPIAHDHEHFLGNNLTAIATEKAGIIKPGIPVISAKQTPEATKVIWQKAKEMNAPLYMEGIANMAGVEGMEEGAEMTWQNPPPVTLPAPSLIGRHQKDNAVLAATTLLAIDPTFPHKALQNGTRQARWEARLQQLDDTLWLDSSHNRHGAQALAQALPNCLTQIDKDKWHMIVGMLNTRPVSDFLAPLIPHIGRMLCVTIPDTPASMQAEELAATARGLGIEAETAKDIHQALATARGLATANQPILITGSIYLAGRVLQEFGIVPG